MAGAHAVPGERQVHAGGQVLVDESAVQHRVEQRGMHGEARGAGSFGERFGSVGGLIAGLAGSHGQGLLDNGARRMRALTGYDRVSLVWGESSAESTRGAFEAAATDAKDLPVILTDADAGGVELFPRRAEESSACSALLRACKDDARARISRAGIRASMRVPFEADGIEGEFRCESRRARDPSFELHAAAELFAQLFAMRLEIDRLKNG